MQLKVVFIIQVKRNIKLVKRFFFANPINIDIDQNKCKSLRNKASIKLYFQGF